MITHQDTHKLSFADLMQQFCNGSAQAADEIARRYTPHLFRVVRGSLPREIRSKVDSIDMVNTLWGALLTKPSSLASIQSPEQLMSMLARAVKNRVIDEHRKYTTCSARDLRRESGPLDRIPDSEKQAGCTVGDGRLGGREISPSQAAIGREKIELLLKDLEPSHKQIVKLRMKGHTYDEISDAIEEVSSTTARRVMKRVVDRLME